MKRILILILSYLLNGAWHSNTKVKDTVNGDGSMEHPMEERDTAYLYCETDEDAKRARHSAIDWKRSNADEYCRFRHGNEDDTIRSGWRKSRLIRGCKSQLNMFGNEVYVCYDRKKDPTILSLEVQLDTKRKEIYDAWIQIYTEKAAELQKGVEQAYGDVAAELAIEEAKAKAATDSKKVAEETLANVNHSLQVVLDQHKSVPESIMLLLGNFDAKLAFFTKNSQKHEDISQEFLLKGEKVRSRLKDRDLTLAQLISIKDEWTDSDSKNYSLLCQETKMTESLGQLHDTVAFSNKLLDDFSEDLQALTLPSDFESVRAPYLQKIDALRKLIEDRTFIFDDQYALLAGTNPSCRLIEKSRNDLGLRISIAARIEEARRTLGVISDFERAVVVIDEAARESNFKTCLEMRSKNTEARFYKALNLGHVSYSKALVDSLDKINSDTVIACTSLTRKFQPQSSHFEKLIETKAKILKDGELRLSFEAAQAMTSLRLKRIKTMLMRKEMEARSSPSIHALWPIEKPDILTSLSAEIGKDIKRPVFSIWSELLNFDEMLNRIEERLQTTATGAPRE